MNLSKIIFTYKKVFTMKILKFVFYGCKQINNNNVFLQLDLLNELKTIKYNEVSQD